MKKKKQRNQESADSTTLIGADSSFEGTYKGNESICIEGEFQGTIEGTNNVYIHEGAKVRADIKASFVMVHGVVEGDISAEEEINIGATGRVNGDVRTKSLTVVTGGCLNGQCRMAEKAGALEEDESGGRFASWKKEAIQSEPEDERLVDLESMSSDKAAEDESEERSAGL